MGLDLSFAPYWDVERCLEKYGKVSTKTVLFPKKYDSAIKSSSHKMGIVAFTWHYFLAKWDKKKEQFAVYNYYNDSKKVRYCNSIDTELKNKTKLCLITF